MYLCTLYLAALQGGRRVKGMIPDSRGGADYMSELLSYLNKFVVFVVLK